MRGTAAAASSVLTVTRTSSEPAAASAATWWAVAATSAVSVLVIDCTTMGWSLPTATPPTFAVTVRLRVTSAIRSSPPGTFLSEIYSGQGGQADNRTIGRADERTIGPRRADERPRGRPLAAARR